MADVFLSYKRSERSQVERIASMLRGLGLTVWFDASMSAGDTFNDEIDREARMARVVLVCWSPDARESEWVKAEAMIGFTQKKLAACYVAGPDNFDPPTPFNTRHAEDLRGWFAAPSAVHSGWKSVLRSIGRLCERADIESYGALDTQATAADLRAWITAHNQSPLFVTVDNLLSERDVEEAERNRVEHDAREQRAREEAERRTREAAERAARQEEERKRPKPAIVLDWEEIDAARGQPRGFLTLLLTEAFERFAYYGARSILFIYLLNHLAFAQTEASTLYAVFTGLLYLLPIFGAIIADRVIGSRRSVATGSLLMLAGYSSLAVSASNLGVPGSELTYAALALVAVGSAFVKPSLLTSLGALYGENDPRRDGGFTILYVGLNLGAFAAALACVYVGDQFGLSAGFALAGAGMLLGLATYLLGQSAVRRSVAEPSVSIGGQALTWALAAAAAAAAFFVLRNARVAEQFIGLAMLAGGATVLLYMLASFGGQERSKLILAFVLIAAVTAFFMLFELAGSALYLFAESNVDTSSLPVTASQMSQMLPAIMTLLLGLPLAFLWIALARSRADPSTGIKFAFGILLVAAGFLVVTFAAQFADQDARIPLAWLITLFLLQGLGELLVVPIGMSAMTKLAPARATNLMMAMWFMGSAFALPLAAQIATVTSTETVGGQVLDPAAILAENVEVFGRVGLIGLGVAVGLLVLWPILSRLARGAR